MPTGSPGPLTWVFMHDSGDDPRADSDAPAIVAATEHGLYMIAPVWNRNEEYPKYGVSYVPNGSPVDVDEEEDEAMNGFVNHQALITLEDSTHYLTDNHLLRQIAQDHHNKTAGGTDAN